MKVVIRTDASLHIGSGHVMRCLVLADAFKRAGHTVTFATRPQKGDLIGLIKQRGFSVCELNLPSHWLEPTTAADYAAWLQVDERQDAQDCMSQLNNVDLVVVDHYGIGIKWHQSVKSQHRCKIMVIDDLVREHAADLIVDQTLLRTPNEYQLLNPTAHILSGTDYAIIHPDFAELHTDSLVGKELKNKPRVLVSMGGVDAPNATLQVLKALKCDFSEPPLVTVLLSARAPHYQQVKRFSEQEKDWVTHIDFVENMAGFMAQYDMAIGAPGSTSWERACLGIPSIIIALADNQLTICKKLSDVGAAISVDLGSIDNDLKKAYQQLLADYAQMRKTNLELCDGLGVDRIIKNIPLLFDDVLRLRCAELKDTQQVFEWQCAPETRQYALNKSVPSLVEHQAWMERKVSNSKDYFYIIERVNLAEVHPESVGVVRLDMTSDNSYILSIFIAPTHFGKGIAKQTLSMLDKQHPSIIINAVVLKENTASHALFHRAGYIKIDEENYIRPPIE
ncbi:pseudaminic acid biosynthesis protein PseG [Marinomonas ushuaiensis DSM 15871]|uniref:Pseudaminic acid biosynthesis protein PseG n=1 Tax=Marinomonas ushuaiensis DSM 15871 TaxID=1122207 RepID=X7E9H8_9GAMM|nr:pseudaminic acid biosynthesis protein PseG [Marinomonas ushuaiensis DSM 15871]